MDNSRILERLLIKAAATISVNGNLAVETNAIVDDSENYAVTFVIGAGGNTDIKLTQTDGATTKDIPGAAITTLAGAGIVAIEFVPTDLDINNGFNEVDLDITTSAAISISYSVLALSAKYEAVDNSLIDEIITV